MIPISPIPPIPSIPPMKLVKLKDTVSPDLLKKARACNNPERCLQAMGSAVVNLGRRAFVEEGLRPSTWAVRKKEPKKPHPLLQDTHALRDGIRTDSLTHKSISIVNSVPYAAAHQFGYEPRNLPARPFLPFDSSGNLTSKGAIAVERALRAALKPAGL